MIKIPSNLNEALQELESQLENSGNPASHLIRGERVVIILFYYKDNLVQLFLDQ